VGLDTVPVTMLYAFVESWAATAWLSLFVLTIPGERKELLAVWHTQKRNALLAGLGLYTTYTTVLVSLAFVRNVSYVVAFRQLSIPIGATFGIVLLKEPRPAPKIAGLAILFTGLLMVALG
jgi:drug/metabolite transporter (DMT)-like permease